MVLYILVNGYKKVLSEPTLPSPIGLSSFHVYCNCPFLQEMARRFQKEEVMKANEIKKRATQNRGDPDEVRFMWSTVTTYICDRSCD